MPEKTVGSVHRTGGSWELNGPEFILHHKHVLEGVVYDSGCNTCRSGLAVVYKKNEEEVSKPDVPESGGVDESGSTSLPQRDGWYRPGKG